MHTPTEHDPSFKGHPDGAIEMITGDQHYISRDGADSWTPLPTHSARLRQMADQLEGVSAEDFLSARVSRFAPEVRIQVGYPAFLAKFGPVGAGPFAGDHIRYTTTVDGVEWMACRPMTDDERAKFATSLAVS